MPISKVKVGDRLLAFKSYGAQLVYATVVAVPVHIYYHAIVFYRIFYGYFLTIICFKNILYLCYSIQKILSDPFSSSYVQMTTTHCVSPRITFFLSSGPVLKRVMLKMSITFLWLQQMMCRWETVLLL